MSAESAPESEKDPEKPRTPRPKGSGEEDRHAIEAHAASVPPPQPRALSHAEIRTIFFGVMLATFLAALNQTIVATALPTIGRHFSDFENLSWLVTAYLLTSTAVAPLYGKLSDIYGRRRMMLTATGLFLAGSVLCAVAPNMTVLILGRALQGIGGGGILPLTQAIIADVVSPRERGRYQAYMGVVWVTSGVGGPVLGGALAEHFSWTAIFWLNVPLGLAAAFLSWRNLATIPRNERKHRLDVMGAALMMASAVPILLALTWGGTRYAWTSPEILALIGASFVLSLLFAWRLTRAPEPFLPLTVLGNPVMRMGTACASFAMGTSIGLTIFLPLYFEIVHGLTATQSGLALIPIALTTPGSIISGQVMLYFKRYKWAPVSALALALVAQAVLVWWPAMPLWHSIALMCVVGTAIGTVYPVTTVSIQNAVPHYQVGIAMGALNFFRSLASAFVVAAMGAILLTGFGSTIGRGAATGDISALAQNVSGLGESVAHVFGWVFFSAWVFLAISLGFLLAMEERPLRSSTTRDPPKPGPEV
jgi:EmrB/QacA subfamily drug resistance transporter